MIRRASTVPGGRSLLASALLCLSLFFLLHRFDRLEAQEGSTPPLSELPLPQLRYITRTPPFEWDFEGMVSAADFGRLLLRSASVREAYGSHRWLLVAQREYPPEAFAGPAAPDLIRLEIGPTALTVKEAPRTSTAIAVSSLFMNRA